MVAIRSTSLFTISATFLSSYVNAYGMIAQIVDANNFCVFLPPTDSTDRIISDTEWNAQAFCLGDAPDAKNAGTLPSGFIQSAHFVATDAYVQVTGQIDPAKANLDPSDDGGQYDVKAPTGSTCAGWKYYVNLIEPSGNTYCIRCCNDTTNCNRGISEKGCAHIIPGDYSGPNGDGASTAVTTTKKAATTTTTKKAAATTTKKEAVATTKKEAVTTTKKEVATTTKKESVAATQGADDVTKDTTKDTASATKEDSGSKETNESTTSSADTASASDDSSNTEKIANAANANNQDTTTTEEVAVASTTASPIETTTTEAAVATTEAVVSTSSPVAVGTSSPAAAASSQVSAENDKITEQSVSAAGIFHPTIAMALVTVFITMLNQ